MSEVLVHGRAIGVISLSYYLLKYCNLSFEIFVGWRSLGTIPILQLFFQFLIFIVLLLILLQISELDIQF